MILTYLSRFGFQGLAFALIARALGSEGFGAFSATLALLIFLSPFVELGAYTLIIRDITARVPVSRVLGINLRLILFSFPVGLIVAVSIKLILLPSVSWELLLSTALAIFLGGRLSVIASAINVSTGVVWRNAVIEVFGGLIQVGFALALFFSKGSVETWGLMYMCQYVGVGLTAVLWVTRTHGIFWGFPPRNRILEGLNFATANSASGAYSELDKTLLQRLSDLQSTGIYAAGFRIITLMAVPIVALLATVAPRFFEKGAKSPRDALHYALSVMRLTALYGVVAAIALWSLAPLAPLALGEDFSSTSDVLKLMAVYVLLQGLQYPLADALTASGMQRTRTLGQLAVLVVSISLNLYLIPQYNWQGAAASALITQLALLIFFAAAWWRVLHTEQGK